MFKLDDNMFQDLWSHDLAIAYFIYNNKSYWILDHSYNYRLDIEAEARASLRKGHITLEIFNRGMKNARGGIPKLSSDTFNDYLALEETIILNDTCLNAILSYDFSLEKLEQIYTGLEHHLSYGGNIADTFFYDINIIKSRLPRYYINFDRKIYLHTDYDLCPEGAVTYPNWVASEGDFSYRIPDKDIYWIVENKNFWKAMYL